MLLSDTHFDESMRVLARAIAPRKATPVTLTLVARASHNRLRHDRGIVCNPNRQQHWVFIFVQRMPRFGAASPGIRYEVNREAFGRG
jgi:hypothetical protein